MASAAVASWRILVVDDEENLNWSLVHSLRKEGYAADGAATGLEAQRRLSEMRYDCVISDVMMPGMDGFDLLQWIRRQQPTARVIMMTAFGSPTTKQEALNNGVVAYLEKPFDLRVLKDELSRLARGSTPAPSPQADEYDLLEVAQVLNLAKRDICLAVRYGGETGHLQFAQGELVRAELGALRGDEAVVTLGAARAIAMQPEAWNGRGERNVTLPLSRLTYLALARREGRATAPLRTTAPEQQSASKPSAPPMPTVEAGTQADAEPDTSDSTPTPQIQGTLDALARTLPPPCGVALLHLDGTLLGRRWSGRAEPPTSVFTHLGQSALAASRALLVGDLGSMDEAHLFTAEWHVRVRRLGRGDRALLLVALVQRAADASAVTSALDAHAPLLADMVR